MWNTYCYLFLPCTALLLFVFLFSGWHYVTSFSHPSAFRIQHPAHWITSIQSPVSSLQSPVFGLPPSDLVLQRGPLMKLLIFVSKVTYTMCWWRWRAVDADAAGNWPGPRKIHPKMANGMGMGMGMMQRWAYTTHKLNGPCSFYGLPSTNCWLAYLWATVFH